MNIRPQRKSGADISTVEPRSAASPRQLPRRWNSRSPPAKPSDRGDQHGERGELDRSPARSRRSSRGDAAAEMDRVAEIAPRASAEPDRVLLGERPVEPHLLALRLDLVLRGVRRHRHCGGIDRQQRAARRRRERRRRRGSGSRRGAASAKRPRSGDDHGRRLLRPMATTPRVGRCMGAQSSQGENLPLIRSRRRRQDAGRFRHKSAFRAFAAK